MSALTCLQCGTLSPAAKKFCEECGAPLPRNCPNCGTTVEATAKFCGECAAPLRPDGTEAALPTLAAPMGEERRLVTVLFCDLVGFTPLAEQLDVEEVRDIQADYFIAMSQQIERFGGTVEKYAGDAVLALFGVPMAHEDDAERAILCALGMRASIEPIATTARNRWQVEPAIRVGVNTGEVVSGTWEVGGRQDAAVTGDAVNTAARIQAAAEPGEVLVGAETMKLTRRRIRYGDRREVTLKGKTGLVPVWPVVDLREEFGERWEGYETPLVGRDKEMVQLLDAWLRAQADEGQLVTVVGDAGVGKSRLVAEFLGRISASAGPRVVRARALSYGQEISLWLVADLLRSLFGIKEQDGAEEIARTLQGVAPALLPDTEIRTEALDVLGEVLGLPIGQSLVSTAGPQIRRQALIRSLRAVLAAVATRAPTVLVLEDLHWIDDASEEVLIEVLRDVLGLRVLVLAAQRPGWNAPWSEWGWPERLTLRPLGDQDSAVLAGTVLGGMRLGREFQSYVAERAGGNPFFMEEMLRALQESGGLEERGGVLHVRPDAVERLPSTLTEVLLARLDRLEGSGRNVAQVASVIGRTFAVRLLAQVVGQEQAALEMPLAQLQRAEIAFPRRNPELEYVFKHVSMRDVAYNTLVQRRRQELHLASARAIAALYPTDEYVEIIAYHYSRTEAPEAADWLERAGDRAAGNYATEAVIAHYGEARRRFEQCGAGDIPLARLNEKLGNALATAGRYDEALEVLGRAAEVLRQIRDLEGAGRVTALIGMAHRNRGTPEEGVALIRPMLDLLARSGPSEALAALHLALANLFVLTGEYREMLVVAGRAEEIARAIGNRQLLGEAAERRGTALALLGEAAESIRVIEEGLPDIEAGGDLAVLWRALTNVGHAYGQRGSIAKAKWYTERALEVIERIGNPDQTSFVLANLGSMLTMQGAWQRAAEHLERAMALVSDGGRTAHASNALQHLAELHLYRGDWEEASRILKEAWDVVGTSDDRQGREEALATLAELDILRGEPQRAIARLEGPVAVDDAALSLFPVLAWAYLEASPSIIQKAEETIAAVLCRARESGERIVLVDALRVQGMVSARQERWEEAQQALEEGLSLARSMPFPYSEARILEQMGRLEEALTIFQRLGARKDIERTAESREMGRTYL